MEKIDDLIKDMENIENNILNNIEKINIIIIKINKNEIEDIIKKKQTYKIINLELVNNILNKINDEYCKNEYKIKYLLNFEINKNIYELDETNLEDLQNNNNYKLEILNKIKNIKYNENNFNNSNSLIIILNKLEKIHYIIKKKKKHNATKKLNN